MADTLPLNFPIPQETAILSFPYSDIQEGTGFVKYYGARVQIDSTAANDDYILSSSSLFSSNSGLTTCGAGDTEFDFDVVFNTPKIVSGKLYGLLPINFGNNGVATTYLSPKVALFKYDGSSETTIVAQTTFQADETTGTKWNETFFMLTVPQTNFKKGETLRVNVVINRTGAGVPVMYLYHSPSGGVSDFTQSGGAMQIFVPFRLVN